MKKKNILKFISLLGIGSFVALSAASCKQPVAEKPTKPTDPKKPTDGGGSSTTNPSSGSGDNSSMSSGGSDSMTSTGSTDSTGSTGTTTPEVNSKAAVQVYVDKLTDASFKLVNDTNQELVKDQTKVSEVNTSNIKLNNDSDPAIKGWTLSFELVPNNDGANADNGTLKFKVKFTKGTDVVTSNEISISGFKTLQTSVAAVLLKSMDVKDSQNQSVSKKVLNLGSAEFKKLSLLNAMSLIATPSGTTSSASTQRGPMTRDSGVAMSDNQANPDGMSNQEKTTGLGAIFKTLVDKEGSDWKNQLAEIKKIYTDFNPENLYLSGQAKLVNLWKSEDDWHGNYYLTSKEEEGNKLSIKYKGKDWSIDLTDGLVIQDLLPDSVKVYVSKTGGADSQMLSEQEQSNIEAYKTRKTTEGSSTKYKIVEDNKLFLQVENKPDVELNPIKINHQESGYAEKILFKAKYFFDGTGLYNGDIFGTKLRFKKGSKWDDAEKTRQSALDSVLISSVWYGTTYIPNSDKENPNTSANNQFEFFWRGKAHNNDSSDTSKGFADSIHGEENSPNGNGTYQLLERDHSRSSRNISDQINNINQEDNVGTNYLIFARIAYRKNDTTDMYGYLWSNTVTILYVEPKTATQK
ncbi:hypothetical protein LNO75_00970 [Mycoplasma sp. T363T]|uniref:lipoprotein 17-related variable surface protein n=1 Tax=Mycoplasma bradburyae TaxID=2963128 RepID=UPI00234034A0|nr:lipoprotein 17-related variable surface protein [Mycoplasma bradburyae]MDC4163149.1 hypothetical protein [Mycoplasma bradburyae]